jgi:hypothetical protein
MESTAHAREIFAILGPRERLRVFVVVRDVLFDGLHELIDAPEHSSADAFASDFTAPPLHEVEPRRRYGDEVEVEAFDWSVEVSSSHRSVLTQGVQYVSEPMHVLD